ncbi:hypothetical protein CSC56_0008 (plasmid) [Staphylococcus aureus]|nr:hypothetical protein CSC56_0008 [Staphylococcus aureus]
MLKDINIAKNKNEILISILFKKANIKTATSITNNVVTHDDNFRFISLLF